MTKMRNRLVKNCKKAGAVLAVLSLTAGSIFGMTGCIGRMTPKKLLQESSANMLKVTSSSNHVELAIQMSDVLDLREVNMELDTENTTEPPAGHAKGTATVNIKDSKVSADLELYQTEEDGKYVTYSSMDGKWSKEAADSNEENHLGVDGNIFAHEGKVMESFHLSEDTVKVDGVECYQMYGDVSGSELIGLLGRDMVTAFNLVELPDETAIRELQIPVIFDIYKDEMLPAKIVVDMSDVLNELYDSFGETTKVNLYSIELKFTDYNQVEEIQVPDEVKNAV